MGREGGQEGGRDRNTLLSVSYPTYRAALHTYIHTYSTRAVHSCSACDRYLTAGKWTISSSGRLAVKGTGRGDPTIRADGASSTLLVRIYFYLMIDGLDNVFLTRVSVTAVSSRLTSGPGQHRAEITARWAGPDTSPGIRRSPPSLQASSLSPPWPAGGGRGSCSRVTGVRERGRPRSWRRRGCPGGAGRGWPRSVPSLLGRQRVAAGTRGSGAASQAGPGRGGEEARRPAGRPGRWRGRGPESGGTGLAAFHHQLS